MSSKLQGPAGFAELDTICRRLTLFTSTDGRAFARIPAASINGHLSLPIHSQSFREWFLAQAYDDHNTTPTVPSWTAIRRHLEAQASRDPSRREIRVSRRVTSRGQGAVPEKLLIDLANPRGEFIEITPAGWHISTGKGVHFETSRSTRGLPTPTHAEPQTPSALDSLREILRFPPNSPDWLRLLAWILTALRPDGPYPILILRGQSDAPCGKSLVARVIRALVDPASAPLTAIPSSLRALHDLAQHHWLLAFDHVSRLTTRMSESLCRLAGGIGIPVREPGNPEPIYLWTKRPILLTATHDFTPSPGLTSRAVTVTLPNLPAESAVPEAGLLVVLEKLLPALLGALCDALSVSLQPTPAVQEPALVQELEGAEEPPSGAVAFPYESGSDRISQLPPVNLPPNPLQSNVIPIANASGPAAVPSPSPPSPIPENKPRAQPGGFG